MAHNAVAALTRGHATWHQPARSIVCHVMHMIMTAHDQLTYTVREPTLYYFLGRAPLNKANAADVSKKHEQYDDGRQLAQEITIAVSKVSDLSDLAGLPSYIPCSRKVERHTSPYDGYVSADSCLRFPFIVAILSGILKAIMPLFHLPKKSTGLSHWHAKPSTEISKSTIKCSSAHKRLPHILHSRG